MASSSSLARIPMPMPLSLSDAEYAAVQAAAAPIHPNERHAFLKALAEELERHPVVGPGLVFRCASELQRRYVVEARNEAQGAAALPTHRLARQAGR
jgi:hypothetical protein